MQDQRTGYVRIQQEGGHLQVKKRDLTSTNTDGTLSSQPPGVWENKDLQFKSHSMCYFIMAAQADPDTSQVRLLHKKVKLV